MPELRVTSNIVIAESELDESFILSSGAGGQNVNKVASAVQLRFDALHSPSLPDDVRVRLLQLGGHRLTKDGVLIVTARESRDQVRNRQIARERLAELIRRAAHVPKKRKADQADPRLEGAPHRLQEAHRLQQEAASEEV